MKANFSIERRLFVENLNKGKKLYSEIIEKIRKKALAKGKIFYSEEALFNMKKNSSSVILYNLNNTIFGKYSSITEVPNVINYSPKIISRALKRDKKILKRRFIVKYKKSK
jgi:hypothetical protein